MTPREQELLEENRSLRIQLDALRADSYAKRGEKIRHAIDNNTLFVVEHELPKFIPYSLKDIVKLRKKGTLRPLPDLRGGKRKVYNLQAVKATQLAGKPSDAKTLIKIDIDKLRAS